MNSKGEENRSVRLTRKRLSDALITLLMQKPQPGNFLFPLYRYL